MPHRFFFNMGFRQFEDYLVNTILRRPGFHRFVERIHRHYDEMLHGPHPNAPPRPGQATEDPNAGNSGFLRHFKDEIVNQLRGTPTDPPPLNRPPANHRPPPKVKP